MKRKRLACFVLTAGLLALGTAGPALAQAGQADRETGFLCNVDLRVLALPPGYAGPVIVSILPGTGVGFTERLCSNSQVGSNVHILCETPVPGWPEGLSANAAGFACQVDRGACGTGGLETTTATSLSVDFDANTGEGDATLRCNLN